MSEVTPKWYQKLKDRNQLYNLRRTSSLTWMNVYTFYAWYGLKSGLQIGDLMKKIIKWWVKKKT